MSEGTRARGRLMPAPFAVPRSGLALLCGARPLCVPVGGGPPARSPHASFARSGRSRGPPWPCRRPPAPRPGPAAAHGHRGQALLRPSHRRCSRNLRLSLLLAAPLVFRAPSGPAAREIATRELRSEWSISRPALALPPPTGTAARPSGPSGALHTSGAWSLMCGSARRLEARPGSAIARGHHKSLA